MGTLRDAILAANDLPTEEVDVPEWAPFIGAPTVRVRGLTAAERDEWDKARTVVASNGLRRPNPKLTNASARFAVLCMVDENGQRIFADDDVEALATSKSSRVIERIVEVGLRLSGMVDEDTNPSKGDQGADSSPESPLPSD